MLKYLKLIPLPIFMALASCDNSTSSTSNPIVGSWRNIDTATITATDNSSNGTQVFVTTTDTLLFLVNGVLKTNMKISYSPQVQSLRDTTYKYVGNWSTTGDTLYSKTISDSSNTANRYYYTISGNTLELANFTHWNSPPIFTRI